MNKEEKKSFDFGFRLGKIEGRKIGKIEGRKDAEEFLQKRINHIIITNHNLLEEILRLDCESPVAGVLLPYKFALKLCKKLYKIHLTGTADRLQKYIDKANPIDAEEALVIIGEMEKPHHPNKIE